MLVSIRVLTPDYKKPMPKKVFELAVTPNTHDSAEEEAFSYTAVTF